MKERYVLITNLDWVTIGQVRTFTHAVVLQQCKGLFEEVQYKVRGFGVDPAWPTFDIFVKSIDYELVDAQGNLFQLKDDGKLEASITGAIMKLEDGPEIELVTCDRKRPLDIEEFEGEEQEGDDRLVWKVWRTLEHKVPEYWTAPNMPTLHWRPAELIRAKYVGYPERRL